LTNPNLLYFAAMTKKKIKEDEKLILITNDDSIAAPGIKALTEVAMQFGRVVVVAPDKPQSGMGHAITINTPLRLEKVNFIEGVEAYTTNGTPVDCVKLAVDKVLHRKPDLCLSGINHGANHSINVIYSGTMSAAMEAAIESIPSIGFSLLDFSMGANFEPSKLIIQQIVTEVLRHKKIDKHLLLNVNIPAIATNKIKGIKVCKQAYAKYEEEFVERLDPHGKKYYWLTGKFINQDKGKDTDVWALENNYVSVVPIQFDLTHYTLKKQIESWKF
jgi:5'-nucleotidase